MNIAERPCSLKATFRKFFFYIHGQVVKHLHYKTTRLCLYLDSLRKSTQTWISRLYSAKIVKLEGVALLASLWESLNSWGTNILILKPFSHFSSFRLWLLILLRPVLILWCHGKSLYFKSKILDRNTPYLLLSILFCPVQTLRRNIYFT